MGNCQREQICSSSSGIRLPLFPVPGLFLSTYHSFPLTSLFPSYFLPFSMCDFISISAFLFLSPIFNTVMPAMLFLVFFLLLHYFRCSPYLRHLHVGTDNFLHFTLIFFWYCRLSIDVIVVQHGQSHL